jgi:hypothetical protein
LLCVRLRCVKQNGTRDAPPRPQYLRLLPVPVAPMVQAVRSILSTAASVVWRLAPHELKGSLSAEIPDRGR